MKAKLSTDHLCDTCRYTYPECDSNSDLEFGDGYCGDNIIECEAYEGELDESTKV